MEYASWIAAAVLIADLLIRLGLSLRIVMRRHPVGVTLAWLMVVLLFPFLGAAIYLFIGEHRLGNRRVQWAAEIHEPYQRWLHDLRNRCNVDWSALGPQCEPLAKLTETAIEIPAMPGNELLLIDDTDDLFRAIIDDIDAAERTCHMEFYIWNSGGLADEVADALLRAAARGITCRILVDAVGSKVFLRSETARRMRHAGIALQAALPGGLLRGLFVRFDLRMHRKIVIVDGQIAYTGSLNMVDPRYFKKSAGVGQWVDAMVRVRGPAVQGLAITFLEDWELDMGEGIERLSETGDVHRLSEQGDAVVQVVPSGPLVRSEAIQQILLQAIYSARRELILTTPYFVPDETLLTALISAARRGVQITIVLPAKLDSLLVRFASQAHKCELLAAGIQVVLFQGGLLHTKSITVDGQISLFGSLNLDPRSLHLNFEITLSVYDRTFTSRLRQLQQSYIASSEAMDLVTWESRSTLERFTENVARLVGPLL